MSMPAPGVAPDGITGKVGSTDEATADGTWALERAGMPRVVLVVDNDRLVLTREESAGPVTHELTRGEGGRFEVPSGGPVADDAAGTSCVEVVAVEAEALVVRMGVLLDGRCVLGDEVLRFARQIQR